MKTMNETITYTPANKHLCRNSFIVPAFISKAMKIMAGIFLPKPCAIEFVERAVRGPLISTSTTDMGGIENGQKNDEGRSKKDLLLG